MLFRGDGIKNIRQRNGLGDNVDELSQNNLDGGPTGITLLELLDKSWFVAKTSVQSIQGSEDFVEGTE